MSKSFTTVQLSATVRWVVNGRRVRFPHSDFVMPQQGEYIRVRTYRNGRVYVRRYKVHTVEHRVDIRDGHRQGYTVVRMTRLRIDRETEWRKHGK